MVAIAQWTDFVPRYRTMCRLTISDTMPCLALKDIMIEKEDLLKL